MDEVIYMGRVTDKKSFRAFIYKKDEKKLINSWSDYQSHMAKGIWFDRQSDCEVEVVPVKKKAKQKKVN